MAPGFREQGLNVVLPTSPACIRTACFCCMHMQMHCSAVPVRLKPLLALAWIPVLGHSAFDLLEAAAMGLGTLASAINAGLKMSAACSSPCLSLNVRWG